MSLTVNPIGSNQTEVSIGNVILLFSYRTIVAMHDLNQGMYFKTTEFHSRTTSKHINKWIPKGAKVELMPPSYFDRWKGMGS